MDYRLLASKHDDRICAHIGSVVGQQPGGWSIRHSVDGADVILTFPDGITASAVDAAVASYRAPGPKVDTEAAGIVAILSKPDAEITAADLKAAVIPALRRLAARGVI